MKKVMADIRSYAGCFFNLQAINLKSSMSVPLDFWIGYIAFSLTQLSGIIFIWVIFSKVKGIAGWSLNEMVFLYGLQLLSMCIYRTIFQGIVDIPYLILNGRLDTILTKPRNTLFMIGCLRTNKTGIMDLVLGTTLVVLASVKMGYGWDVPRILQLAAFILSANLIIISIMLAQGSFAFWLTSFDAFHEIVMALREYTRYPVKIFHIFIRAILYAVIPVAFASYVPASILLAKDGFSPAFTLVPPLVGAAVFVLAAWLFKQGLKNYTSSN